MSSFFSMRTVRADEGASQGAASTSGTSDARVTSDSGPKCFLGDRHIHRDDFRRVAKECQEESFWYRALPLSLGSMAVTGGLIYNGTWKSSARFGPFPKLVVAGILGYVLGKASYVRTCQSKFQAIGLSGPGFGPGFGPGYGPGFGPGFGQWSEGRHSGPGHNHGHRHCQHVCDDCKRQAQTATPEKVQN